MRIIPLAGLALMLAGCATLSPEELRARAANTTNFDLCRAQVIGSSSIAQAAIEEAARRSLDCSPYMAAIIQREQASNAASMATALQLLNQRPAMIQAPSFPSTTSCRSYRVGNDIRTDCN